MRHDGKVEAKAGGGFLVLGTDVWSPLFDDSRQEQFRILWFVKESNSTPDLEWEETWRQRSVRTWQERSMTSEGVWVRQGGGELFVQSSNFSYTICDLFVQHYRDIRVLLDLFSFIKYGYTNDWERFLKDYTLEGSLKWRSLFKAQRGLRRWFFQWPLCFSVDGTVRG